MASVPGHPDAWLAKFNVALFVHGCFWHRHPGCKYAYTPKSRVELKRMLGSESEKQFILSKIEKYLQSEDEQLEL